MGSRSHGVCCGGRWGSLGGGLGVYLVGRLDGVRSPMLEG